MLKEEFIDYINRLATLQKKDNIELILCPPTTYLYLFQNIKFKIGSQEISMYPNGAYTGENSGEQLRSLQVSYALIAHSESREILKENPESLTKKIINAHNNMIRPIYFIGETNKDLETNNKYNILKEQITSILDNLNQDIINNMLIAYEPVWSIGTEQIPDLEELSKTINYIKQLIKETYNISIPILYGGSVNTTNISGLSDIKELNGIVLGESATNIDTLESIYNNY